MVRFVLVAILAVFALSAVGCDRHHSRHRYRHVMVHDPCLGQAYHDAASERH